MMLLALAIALHGQPGPLVARPAIHVDSVAARKFLDKVRRAEVLFIVEWRHQWEHNRITDPTAAKFSSLHCHFDDFTEQSQLHLIRSGTRKSMCPVWHDL